MATRHAPDVKIPLAHIFTGVVAALLGGLGLLWRGPSLLRYPVGNFETLALTHIFTLGYVAMTITGATYQLIPVVLEVPLSSERLAALEYPALLVGIALMVVGFGTADLPLLISGAFLVGTALLVYGVHITVTVLRSRDHRLHRAFFLGAMVYLGTVCVLGGLLAADFRWGFLRVDLLAPHVVVAILGWITLLAMGVSYKLTPMFALSHGHQEGNGMAVFLLGAVGTIALALGVGRSSPIVVAALGLAWVAAVALFLRDQWYFFRLRNKPRLDVGLRLTTVGFGYLGLLAIIGWLDLCGLVHVPAAVLVVLALLGWLGCLIAGQTYKIVPFLVWFYRYAARAGRGKVPLLREMYSERIAGVGMWSLAAAALLIGGGASTGAAWLLRLGALAWLCGYGALAYNLAQVLRA